MSPEIIVNTNMRETRVAIMENGDISELYIERKKDEGIVGNVYKGRVVKVLPGMQVAFIDIGLGKSGFLYVSDINVPDTIEEYEKLAGEDISLNDEMVDESEEEMPRETVQKLPIEELLQEGQEILVQVSKDPIGSKGARITSYISLPGRYLVFMPSVDHV